MLNNLIGSFTTQENSLDIAQKIMALCQNNLCEFWKLVISDLQGALLELSVPDHIIVAHDVYYSFADEGAM